MAKAEQTQSESEKQAALEIESGEYFENAMDWYSSKYVEPITHRAYFLLITVIALLTIFFAYKAITGILPVTEQVPLVVQKDDIFKEVPSLAKLADTYGQTNAALIRFHVSDYVRAREEYLADKIDANFRRVRALSADEVFAAYRQYMDPANPDSPIARYERHTNSFANIQSVTVFSKSREEGAIPDSAEVEFETVTLGGSGERKVERWAAEMTFSYKNLVVDQETYKVTPMEFTVTSYKLKQLLGGK